MRLVIATTDLTISDLGVDISEGEKVNLLDQFPEEELDASTDLTNLLSTGDLYEVTDSKPGQDQQTQSYAIYDYLKLEAYGMSLEDRLVAPKHVDYKSGLTTRLHPSLMIVKGEVDEVVYYGSYDPDTATFSKPVVKEQYVYTRDEAGLAQYRTCTISWYLEDGTETNDVKLLKKYYSPEDSIREGKRRRSNVVDGVTKYVLGLLQATETNSTLDELIVMGQDFMAFHKTALDNFQMSSDKHILTDLADDTTHAWLDNVIDANGTTIRDYLIAEMTI